MSLATQKLVKKRVDATPLRGLVDVGGLKRLAKYLEEQTGSHNAGDAQNAVVDELLRALQEERHGQRVTDQAVEAAIAQLQGLGAEPELVSVISAFDVPKVNYDPIARTFYANLAPRELFADADAKHRLYMDRLYLIQQRMRRSRMFQRKLGVQVSSEAVGPQLTDLQSLRGIVNVRKIVLGCISRSEDGKCVLEDMTASVPLDISHAALAAGFCTENCIVIAEGELRNTGVFEVCAMGFPPTELRADLPMCAKHLNMFGGPVLSTEQLEAVVHAEHMGEHDEDRIILLADVWLDCPTVIDDLNAMFAAYNEAAQVPAMFVLMGNFHSRASGSGAAGGSGGSSGGAAASGGAGTADGVDFATMRDLFNTLASIIDQYSRIKADSRFVFVPGPGDPSPSQVLPLAPLLPFFTTELRRVLPTASFTSNPCRLRFLTHELVLFRYDILKRLRRRCLLPPPETSGAMWGQLALTLLQQSHLCPLPLLQQPIWWQLDHAMHLYPLPHGVVVADTSTAPAEFTLDGCCVLNPGSYAQGGHFASYMPVAGSVERCRMPRQGDQAEEDLTQQEEEQAGQGQQQEGQGGQQEGQAAEDMEEDEESAEGGGGRQQQERGAAAAAKSGGGVEAEEGRALKQARLQHTRRAVTAH